MHNNLERIAFRVSILAIAEFIVIGLVLVIGLIGFPATRPLLILLCAIGMSAAVATHWLRRSAFVEPVVYANIVLMLVLVAIVDPLSGTLSGSTWTLYQLWPPLAALVLRSPRSAAIVLVAAVITLSSAASLQISGVIPVVLTVSASLLWFNLSIQILVMSALSSILSVVTFQEQRAYTTALQLGAARAQQLAENQSLLDEQARLNQELRASLDQVQQRDKQLRDEQALRADLLRTVDALSAPVIPLSDDLVVAPLVGSFDHDRLAALANDLLAQIDRRRAHSLILDVTGLVAFDAPTAQTLLAVVESCRLLGTQTVIVGVQPEMAQTIVGLGIDLQHVATRANLQEAIHYAMAQIA